MGFDINSGRILDEKAIRDIATSLGNLIDLDKDDLASAIHCVTPGIFR